MNSSGVGYLNVFFMLLNYVDIQDVNSIHF